MIKRGKSKIKVDYRMPDYYKFYKKNLENPVDKHKYKQVIEDFNLELQDLLLFKGVTYKMPGLNFELVLKKSKRTSKVKDGKLYTNIPINWVATRKMWEEHPETKNNRYVRYNNSHSNNYVFKIYLKKFKSAFKFRSLYKFDIVRQFKRKIGKEIKNPDNNIDAYLLY